MPYVERNEQSEIVGAYANAQPGSAEEFLSEDSAEWLAYIQPPTSDEIDTETLNHLLVEEGSVVRGLALVMLDELNRHAATITSILDAADSASNLAQFKSSMAAITDAPQRTTEQLKTALKAKMRS